MDWSHFTSTNVILAIDIVVSCWVLRKYLGRRHERRTRELEGAAAALKLHYSALEQILGEAAISEKLRSMLLLFSDATANREVACRFAERVRPGGFESASDDAKDMLTALHELQIDRPDLADAYFRAVAAGMMAMLLRWPETARKFDQFMTLVGVSQRSEVVFAADAARAQQAARARFGIGSQLQPA